MSATSLGVPRTRIRLTLDDLGSTSETLPPRPVTQTFPEQTVTAVCRPPVGIDPDEGVGARDSRPAAPDEEDEGDRRRSRGSDGHCDPPPMTPRVRRKPSRGLFADRGACGRHQRAGRRPPVPGLLRHSLLEDGVQPRRHACLRRRLFQMGVDDGDVARALERDVPRQALVEEAGEGVDVGSAAHLPAPDLLGRDVVDRPHDLTRIDDRSAVRRARAEAEVREVAVLPSGTTGEEDVRRLDVAVHETALVGGVERSCDLSDEGDCALGRQRTLSPEQRLQVRPVDVPHRDVEESLDLPRVVDRHDVRVIERRR
jgi:hypothetical protein